MQKNYFNWLHLINDLKPLIEKTQIKSIFTQRKDEIILHLLNPAMDSELGLRISIDSQLPFMITEKTISRKSNSVGLFQDLYEKKIERLHIVQGQRLVVLYFDDSELKSVEAVKVKTIVADVSISESYYLSENNKSVDIRAKS